MFKRRSNGSEGRVRWLRLAALALLIVGSVLVYVTPPQSVKADPGQPGPYNRRLNYGYFFNRLHTSGTDVIPGGINSTSLNQFIADIRNRAQNVGGGWSLQNRRGAEFIIQTMRNAPGNTFPTLAEINDWEARVRSLVANGGSINFNAPVSFTINSYWQVPGDDDAFFTLNGGTYVWHPGNFYDGERVGNSIAFYNSAGQRIYAIRRACGNPVGTSFPGLPPAVSHNLNPVINATVVGAPAGSTVAEAGDTITFNYRINSTTGTASGVVNCHAHNVNHTGYFATPATPETGGANVPTSCPRTFPGNSSTQVATESVTAAFNTTVCRTLFVEPATSAGIERGTQVCVVVAGKPYMKVYGGDVSAGGGLETSPDTCSVNNNAAVVAWNRGSASSFVGASSQYAVQATAGITDFATALGNAGGAPAGTGLAFANTSTNLATGLFGGNFGSSRCIKDYYGERASLGALPNVSTIATGSGLMTYEGTTDTTLGALTLNPGDRWTIYVNGHLRLTGNIQFNTVGMNAANMPFLKIVARGNIYVGGGVTQLDGLYIAQVNGASTGTIYTCATGSPLTAPTLANGAFYNGCNNKLVVNGAFIANSVEFGRTRGTLRGSTVAEQGTSNNLAEVFNFGPAFWMAQPPQGSGRVDSYDAITSLPPVL